MKKIKILILALVGLAVLICGIGIADRFHASHGILHVHCPPGATAIVSASNLAESISISDSDSSVPLRHGVYTIQIVFRDGQRIDARFLHHDAGRRKKVDIFIERPEGQNTITFRQIVNGAETVFTGSTLIESASPERPFTLDWI